MDDPDIIGVYNVTGFPALDLECNLNISRTGGLLLGSLSDSGCCVNVLFNKVAATGDMKPWLHIQLFPSTLVHIPPTTHCRTVVNGSCKDIDDGHNKSKSRGHLSKLRE